MPEDSAELIDAGARQGRDFAPERTDAAVNVFEAVVAHIKALQAARKKVMIALWSEGSRERMASMLRDHKLLNLTSVNAWRTLQATPRNETMLAVVGHGIRLRERQQSPSSANRTSSATAWCGRASASRKLENFISEVTSLSPGDLVVHVEHGIGRFVGLQTLDVAGAPHDCLELRYAGRHQTVPAGREYRAVVALRLGTAPMSNWIGWAAAAGRPARPS